MGPSLPPLRAPHAPSGPFALTSPLLWRGGRGRGGASGEPNRRCSEATYAQCGRQHFHPTFAVAMSAGSMVSAWPTEQRPHPERKGRVTNAHRRSTPPRGRQGSERLLATLWPPGTASVGGGPSPGVPGQLGVCGFPHRCPWEAEPGASPLPGTSSQEESVGFHGAPPAGRGRGMQACPPLTQTRTLGQEGACGGGR